ncbi:hypothetical protein SD51_04480 [Alicyclobacillus tengchongensis]|nr:hypothetical protein SD51_04480 [Alicyclobacillus tengchongensis]
MIACIVALSGCGQTNTASSNNSTNSKVTAKLTNPNETAVTHGNNLITGSKTIAGKANQQHLVQIAQKDVKSYKAQLTAAQSALMNGDASTAITYYKRAAALQPNSGEALTAIGNVYRILKNDVKSAIPYYEQSTKVDPSYAFGWYQLAAAEAKLGDVSAAKSVIETGLKKVKSSDPAYATLQSELQTLEGGQSASKANSSK